MGYIFKTEEIDKNFTKIPNSVIQNNDYNLSLEALVVLSHSISHKYFYELNLDYFEKKFKISKEKRQKAMKELKNKKFLMEKEFRVGSRYARLYLFSPIPMTDDEIKEYEKIFEKEKEKEYLKEYSKNNGNYEKKDIFKKISKSKVNNQSYKNTKGSISKEDNTSNSFSKKVFDPATDENGNIIEY